MMFPSVQTFPVEGVHLNPDTSHKCNKEICSVVLDNLNRRSTGSYRCEISGDAPEFHIVHETANMTVAGEFVSIHVDCPSVLAHTPDVLTGHS